MICLAKIFAFMEMQKPGERRERVLPVPSKDLTFRQLFIIISLRKCNRVLSFRVRLEMKFATLQHPRLNILVHFENLR